MNEPETQKISVINGQLPILTNPPLRPVFGSPEVSRYGAVGLDVELAETSEPAISAISKRISGSREVYEISPSRPLTLTGSVGHHEVDGYHLWIGISEGKVLVADDLDNEFMNAYVKGCSPAEALAQVVRKTGLDETSAWQSGIRFLGRLAAAGFVEGIAGYHSVKTIQPHSFARFHLTQRCQLECVHCYTSSGPHLPRDGELSVARWIDLVEQFADNGGRKILFTGGEALVLQGCVDIMRRAHDRGLEVTLFTNGILVPRYWSARRFLNQLL